MFAFRFCERELPVDVLAGHAHRFGVRAGSVPSYGTSKARAQEADPRIAKRRNTES